jgi:hypothetical protein
MKTLIQTRHRTHDCASGKPACGVRIKRAQIVMDCGGGSNLFEMQKEEGRWH